MPSLEWGESVMQKTCPDFYLTGDGEQKFEEKKIGNAPIYVETKREKSKQTEGKEVEQGWR